MHEVTLEDPFGKSGTFGCGDVRDCVDLEEQAAVVDHTNLFCIEEVTGEDTVHQVKVPYPLEGGDVGFLQDK